MPLTPAHFDDALARLRERPEEYFGGPLLRLELSDRAHGRCGRVLRASVETRERRFGIFLKRFVPAGETPNEVARQRASLATEFTRTRQAEAAFASRPDLGVARPIAMFDDLLTIVTEEAPGAGLDVLLKRLALRRTRAAREEVIAALTRLGTWLRIFQRDVPVADPGLQKDYRRYLELRLRDLRRAGGIDDRGVEAARAAFEREAALLAPGDLAPVAAHADLCPPNVLASRDRLTVIDLAASVDRARHMDVAFVYLHLALAGRHLLLGRSAVRHLQAAFLHAYDPALETSAPAFRLMLLLQVIAQQCTVATLRHRGVKGAIAEWRLRRERPWALELALTP